MGLVGELLTIHGSSFGAERGASYVSIAGAQPASTAYELWSDDRIVMRVPNFGDAGLVVVSVEGRSSNGALFVNAAAVPRPAESGSIAPAVVSVAPQSGAVGALVTIVGRGFGNQRGSGAVFFSSDSIPGARGLNFIEASEAEFGYELWSDQEIRARVPDGATSGHIEVRTARGVSLPIPFAVSEGPGTRVFGDRQTFIIAQSVSVEAREAESPNSLSLWVPAPALSASQRGVELLASSPAPFLRNRSGTALFRLENMEAGSSSGLSLYWAVDSHAISVSARPQAVSSAPSPLREAFTAPCARVASDDPRAAELAAAIFSGEANHYLRARLAYDWILDNMAWEERFEGDIFDAAEDLRADALSASLLYVALLRASGVPSRPVAGVLARDRRTLPHHWAEFWIDGLGWIPVDPAMGAFALPDEFRFVPEMAEWTGESPEAREFYFGSVDSFRIAFSRGVEDIPRSDPRGRAVAHERSYALQTLWEEASGGLESYSSVWGAIIIEDVR